MSYTAQIINGDPPSYSYNLSSWTRVLNKQRNKLEFILLTLLIVTKNPQSSVCVLSDRWCCSI
jgi:hypothetical protein